jgi:hypothetical protein
MTIQEIHREFSGRLHAVRRRENRAALAGGVLLTASAATVLALLGVSIEAVFHLGSVPRTVLVMLIGAFTCGVAVRMVVLPLARLLGLARTATDEELADRVGRAFPGVQDRLVNLLQLADDAVATRHYSGPLIQAALERGRREFASFDFTSTVDFSAAKRWGFRAAVVALAAVAFCLFLPSTAFDSTYRLLHFSSSFIPPQPFRFEIDPGSREVVRGETVPVRIRLIGEQRSELVLMSRPLGQRTTEEQVLHPAADGVFHAEFSSLKITTTYSARAGDVTSGEYTLAVVERPVVTSLRLRLAFPAYAGIPPRELDENTGDVTALEGTRIAFHVQANKPLAGASLVFSDGTESPLTLAEHGASGTLAVGRSLRYHLLLRDAEGRTNADPIEYAIRAVPDAPPTAAIPVPGTNMDIAENTQVSLLVRITDDYGFSSLRLAYRLTQSRYEQPAAGYTYTQIPLPAGLRTEGQIAHLWPLTGLHLVPEDVVSYYVEVFDNDRIRGPKSGKSEVFTLRLPSLEEVFADVETGHEKSLEGMKDALDQAREARRELEELQQEMRKEQQKSSWEQQKKAEQMSSQYKEIQKKLDDVASTVDKMVQEMKENQVLSPQTLEKYQELQQLMQDLNSPEFAEALKKLQEQMQQTSPEEMRRALEQFSFSEEAFRKSIERTMNLLKRIQIEQKLDEVVKRTAELQKAQEEIARQTEQANPQDRDRLAELASQQKKLQEELDRLAKEMSDLSRKMDDFPGEMPTQDMEQAMQEMEQSDIDEQMAQSAADLQQQQPQSARQQQQKAMQGLGKMMQRLQQTQQNLQQNQQREVVNAMRRALQDLLALSRREEELKNQSRSLEPNSRAFRENAQEQMEVMRDLGRVTESMGRISQRTFGITPEMGKAIGDAMRGMDQAMQSLEQRNGGAAGDQQEGAMASLNAAANMVQGALGSMMQPGGQGMGMAGFMQRLQQMSGAQQGINQGTRNMGGMTPQRAAEMGRLAGEQGMVRKSLEQLAREAAGAGELSRMLGDLNRVAQEMREVQTDLAQGNVNPETLRKQDRILSRLLDSQRSTRERDYEKKRRAESGNTQARTSPGPLDPDGAGGRTLLQQDMLKAMEEGYAPDYQELIRKYFELLEQQPPRR